MGHFQLRDLGKLRILFGCVQFVPLRLVGGDDDDQGPQKLSNSDRHVTLALKKRHGVLGIPGIHNNPPNKQVPNLTGFDLKYKFEYL